MEGIPALAFWELVIDVFHPMNGEKQKLSNAPPVNYSIYDALTAVDYVPLNVPVPNGRAMLVLLDDQNLH